MAFITGFVHKSMKTCPTVAQPQTILITHLKKCVQLEMTWSDSGSMMIVFNDDMIVNIGYMCWGAGSKYVIDASSDAHIYFADYVSEQYP